MPHQILIISPCAETVHALCNNIRALNYPATGSTVPTNPSLLEQPPALCIIDLQVNRDIGSDRWSTWLQDCLSSNTACLAFDLSTQPAYRAIAKLGPIGDTLAEIEDQALLAGKIDRLLTTRKLVRQLKTTRHQLSLCQAELQEALLSAANIQRSLIPTRQPHYHKLHYSWQYMPCRQVGGDLFNIIQLDEQTIMTYLLDVSGHGISSAMVTVSVHQSLSLPTSQLIKKPTDHPPFYRITPPGQVLQALEAEYPFERFEEFFTISYMLINPHTGQLCYSNGGHPPPLLLRSDGSVERLDSGGTVIGVGKAPEFEEGNTRLNVGDRLFMYTDGITEHLGKAGDLYGEQRFLEQLLSERDKPLDKVTREALIAMRKFGGSTLPTDDVTLIGMEFK